MRITKEKALEFNERMQKILQGVNVLTKDNTNMHVLDEVYKAIKEVLGIEVEIINREVKPLHARLTEFEINKLKKEGG
ncbi:MAG: hypothetical protein QXO37_09535 [Candidatus Nitrosocaldaceae archaeon]